MVFCAPKASQENYQSKVTIENDIKHFDRGEVRYFDGVPVIKLEGSYYDMGLQYGVLMKKEMNRVGGEIDTFLDDVTASYPCYLRPVVPIVIKSMLKSIKKRFPAYYVEEIEGMSEGSGVDFYTLMFMAAGSSMMTSACSSIMVKLDDRIIHGRDFDWEPPMLGQYPAIVEYHPEGKKSFTCFSFVGFPGVIQAVNEEGLSMTLNIAYGMFEKNNKGLPITYKTREIMENASNLSEAGGVIRTYKTDEPGWMITIASANEGSGAIFEMYDNNITETPMSGKYEYVHNILFQPELVGDMELSKKYNEVFLGQTEWNLARHYTTDRVIKDKGINSIDDMIDYLKSTDFYEYENVYLADNATINNEYTINTLVFDVKNDVVYFAVAQSYSAFAKMYQYNLKDRTLTLFKEADPKMESPELKEKIDWYCKYKKHQYRGEFKEIVKEADFSSDLTPGQLGFISDAWHEAKGVKPEILIASIDKQIAKYPNYGRLYLIKGDVFECSGKCKEAAKSYEQALATPNLSNQYRLEILSKLVKINEKENSRLAKDQMRQYCALIDELRNTHHIGDDLEKDYKKFKKKLSK
jgi:hypothetical protein